jgi:hypothetical protein
MLEQLFDLYKIHSPSGQEEKISGYIQEQLTLMGVPFEVDEDHQIFNIIPGTPLVSAHMDQVQFNGCTDVIEYKGNLYGMKDHVQAGLGADDKNGCWIILQLLKSLSDKISFIFSSQEEHGGVINKVAIDNTYAIVLDRRGNSDIIGVANSYCCSDLQDEIAKIGESCGYTPCNGVFSDADALSKNIGVVNLSVGYYNAHSNSEYTNIDDLYKALLFTKAIIKNIPNKKYDIPEPRFSNFAFGAGKITKYNDLYDYDYTKPFSTPTSGTSNALNNFKFEFSDYHVECDDTGVWLSNDKFQKLLCRNKPRVGTVIEVTVYKDDCGFDGTVVLENSTGELYAFIETDTTGGSEEIDVMDIQDDITEWH